MINYRKVVQLQDQPMVYEHDDVTNALDMRHGVMQKTTIPMNPQIETSKL